jgi:hypothetical protein
MTSAKRVARTEDDLNVANHLLMRVLVAALLPLYHRNILTAAERDAVHDARDVLDALLARGAVRD